MDDKILTIQNIIRRNHGANNSALNLLSNDCRRLAGFSMFDTMIKSPLVLFPISNYDIVTPRNKTKYDDSFHPLNNSVLNHAIKHR